MSNVTTACLATLFLLANSQRAAATPPVPGATLSLPAQELKGVVRYPGGLATVAVSVTAHRPVDGLTMTASLRPDVNPLLEKTERTPLIEMPIDVRPQQSVRQRVQIKLPKPGRYVFEVLLRGKTNAGAFSDRLVRHLMVDANGNYRVQTPEETEKARVDTQRSSFKTETEKHPKQPDTGLAFARARRVPDEVVKRVKPWPIPTEQQIHPLPAKLPEILQNHVIDETCVPAPQGDPITVRGHLIFPDYDGVVRPIVHATVWIWDVAAYPYQLLEDAVTDENGYWSVSLPAGKGFPKSRNLVHVFGLANDSLETRTCSPAPMELYAWQSEVRKDCGDGDVVDFGWLTPETSVSAVQVWSTLNLAWGHTLTVGRENPGLVGSCFPAEKTLFTDIVRVEEKYSDGPDTITHEYGHAVMARAYAASGGTPSPGGKHNFYDCKVDERLAWAEGWATAFMLSVRPDGVYDWHETAPGEGQSIEEFSADTCETGQTSEGRVAAALNDMLDAANDDNAGHLERGRTGHVDGNATARAPLRTLVHDTLWGARHLDVLEFWSDLRCQLDTVRQNKGDEIMAYNYMPDSIAGSCTVRDVVANPAQRDSMRSGLRRVRELIQFVDRAGAALLDRFDRNAPEIALLLVDKPQESALALDVMQYLAELGDAAALQDGRARISTAPVVPARLRAPVDALFAWLERRGSAELKTDLLEIRAAYNRLKDQHLLDLERNAPSRVETAPREPTGVKRSELNPMSRTALANPALQSLARVSRPR